MVRKISISLATVSAFIMAGCGSSAASQDSPDHVEFTLPDAPDADQPRHGRVQQILAMLQPLAIDEVEQSGSAAIPFANQVGYNAEYYLIGAVGEAAQVYYVAPFLGPYPSGDVDPWDLARTNGTDVTFDACRFVIRPDDLPDDRRFALSRRFTSLWPEPSTCAAQTDADDNPVPEGLTPLANGYEVFDMIEGEAGARAALVVHPSFSHARFDPDAALDHYLEGREVAWSMALPIASWNAAVAGLTDGTRIYLANPSRENARACVFEGLDWDTFRSFESGEEHPLRTFCNAAIAAHQQDYREHLNSLPPPRIQAMPVGE